MQRRWTGLVLALGTLLAPSTGCSAATPPGPVGGSSSPGATVVLPTDGGSSTPARSIVLPPGGGLDYQLGGAYPPPEGTAIVARDSTASPVPGLYNICYLNGFQSQPGEADQWAGLLLDNGSGPVADPGWPDEYLFDTSTADHRQRLAARMAEQIRGCAEAGFEAVEFDNLDSFLRSGGALSAADNLALAESYIASAHGLGLAVAQKNAVDLVADGVTSGFDFAVAESCGAYDECDGYLKAYDVVLDIEYATAEEFAAMCASGTLPDRSVRRDVGLGTPASPDYVFARCP